MKSQVAPTNSGARPILSLLRSDRLACPRGQISLQPETTAFRRSSPVQKNAAEYEQRFLKPKNPMRVVLNRIGDPREFYGAAREPINTPQKAFEFWINVIAKDPSFEDAKEHLVAIMHDVKHRPLCYHVISTGSLNESIAHPREIFRAAVVASAYGIIMAHNHPSGDPSPSEADRRLTKRIREVGEILRIALTDHVIVGTDEGGRVPHFSFREAGLL